eukprot:TRINITY_DN843_c0_g1_i1.p1 TRINITY_DN843_c0_g1~~TRINITY_DN843_c0_g1_i1.p1  ORF type:complete len:565 (+),score=152.24 TRINITY_DN843_c0_g1_i1:62-1756(+)
MLRGAESPRAEAPTYPVGSLVQVLRSSGRWETARVDKVTKRDYIVALQEDAVKQISFQEHKQYLRLPFSSFTTGDRVLVLRSSGVWEPARVGGITEAGEYEVVLRGGASVKLIELDEADQYLRQLAKRDWRPHPPKAEPRPKAGRQALAVIQRNAKSDALPKKQPAPKPQKRKRCPDAPAMPSEPARRKRCRGWPAARKRAAAGSAPAADDGTPARRPPAAGAPPPVLDDDGTPAAGAPPVLDDDGTPAADASAPSSGLQLGGTDADDASVASDEKLEEALKNASWLGSVATDWSAVAAPLPPAADAGGAGCATEEEAPAGRRRFVRRRRRSPGTAGSPSPPRSPRADLPPSKKRRVEVRKLGVEPAPPPPAAALAEPLSPVRPAELDALREREARERMALRRERQKKEKEALAKPPANWGKAKWERGKPGPAVEDQDPDKLRGAAKVRCLVAKCQKGYVYKFKMFSDDGPIVDGDDALPFDEDMLEGLPRVQWSPDSRSSERSSAAPSPRIASPATTVDSVELAYPPECRLHRPKRGPAVALQCAGRQRRLPAVPPPVLPRRQ